MNPVPYMFNLKFMHKFALKKKKLLQQENYICMCLVLKKLMELTENGVVLGQTGSKASSLH